MMMIQSHIAFGIELIALGMGGAFIIWAARNDGAGVGLAKILGYVISILAIIALLCSLYSSTKYWKKGYHKKYDKHKYSRQIQEDDRQTKMQGDSKNMMEGSRSPQHMNGNNNMMREEERHKLPDYPETDTDIPQVGE